MPTVPRISVVTSSYNQGPFIGRTIDSVLSQDYPNLEHIVVDGMSSDETPKVLSRYPHLQVIREPDRGQSDAINKGFRVATGEILCFLNSDDTFLPGALRRVVEEIDPNKGRHVVMGRCRYIDEDDNFVGLEHPSMFVNHQRVLEIWKGHCIPQPAVFWTREVWDRCGPLDEREQLVLDYDLFCRFSKHYHFHWIDQVFANYRLHTQSKSIFRGERQMYTEALRVSRKYWGSPLTLRFWKLRWSLSRSERRQRALALLRQGRVMRKRRDWLNGAIQDVLSLAAAPDIYLDTVLLPAVERRFPRLYERLGWLARRCDPHHRYGQTLAWKDFAGVHPDGWVGPSLVRAIDVAPGQTHVRLEGSVTLELGRLPQPLEIEFFVDDRLVASRLVGRATDFALEVPLGNIEPGRHELRLECNTFFVGHAFLHNRDYRPLSFKLRQLELAGY